MRKQEQAKAHGHLNALIEPRAEKEAPQIRSRASSFLGLGSHPTRKSRDLEGWQDGVTLSCKARRKGESYRAGRGRPIPSSLSIAIAATSTATTTPDPSFHVSSEAYQGLEFCKFAVCKARAHILSTAYRHYSAAERATIRS